ncbi:Hypothetical protein POVR1_LOCUS516 [uncultured virus]|nr:Hypothetical protein POVR1_LOCUS516 [uncultured virus]
MEKIQTGDLMLFSRKSVPGLFVQTFMNSPWNHVGIALRMKDSQLSLHDGDLYVLDVRAVKRYDEWTKTVKSGAGCSPIAFSLRNSSRIAWRQMSADYQDHNFLDRLKEFINRTIDTKNGTTSQMLSIWSGIRLYQGDENRCSCSEYVARYLSSVVTPDRTDLGKKYPAADWLVSPGSFSAQTSGQSKIFADEVYVYSHARQTVTYWIVAITLFILIIAVLWLMMKLKNKLTNI